MHESVEFHLSLTHTEYCMSTLSTAQPFRVSPLVSLCQNFLSHTLCNIRTNYS